MSQRVFVSSTSEDLKDYRAAARLAILDVEWEPEMMEHFPAQPGYTIDVCRQKLEKCSLVLLIAAWRQGWVPTEDQGGDGLNSITALEVKHADDKHIPVLALFANEYWPGKYWDREETKETWVREFRGNLNRPAQFFEFETTQNLPAFRTAVKQALLAYKETLLRDSASNQQAGALNVDPTVVDGARDALSKGRRTPVLGYGIFGEGPLSSPALVSALRASKPNSLREERMALATAAEYYERKFLRIEFLESFARIIRQQCAQAPRPAILDLLTGLNQVNTIISATYDGLTEEMLQRSARPFTLVSHVLRLHGEADRDAPAQGDENQDLQPQEGKVMVVRPGDRPRFYWADGFTAGDSELVVYKPQGSAELTPLPDSDLRVDTGVITETDYALFLRQLGNRQKGVPANLIKRLRLAPLLFLGYTMDEWQYRLITLLYQVTGRQERRTFAVRIPCDEVEETAWGGLNAELIRMDPNLFARGATAFAAHLP
jgi:hypothetical protein